MTVANSRYLSALSAASFLGSLILWIAASLVLGPVPILLIAIGTVAGIIAGWLLKKWVANDNWSHWRAVAVGLLAWTIQAAVSAPLILLPEFKASELEFWMTSLFFIAAGGIALPILAPTAMLCAFFIRPYAQAACRSSQTIDPSTPNALKTSDLTL